MELSNEQNGDIVCEGDIVVSKPIKKRVLDDDDDMGEEDDDDDTGDRANETSHRSSHGGHQERASDHDIASYEARAKKDLYAFLTNKGIDAAKEARDFQVHVKLTRNRKSNSSTPGDTKSTSFTVTFTGPDGRIYHSKGDVYSTIRDSLNRRQSKAGISGISRSHSEIIETAKSRYAEIGGNMPLTVDGITVLKFGEIDVSNTAFHTPVQIYPTGYKAELTLPAAQPALGGRIEYRSPTPVTVEVVNNDHFPEFIITVKSTGQSYWASSELAAWRKFDPFADDSYSFFNLQIELLIEGMPGADFCREYKFHEERGYGDSYTTQEGNVIEKVAFLNKGERERRNQQRQMARQLRPEEIKRNAELQRRREQDDKEHAKRLEALERERKVLEKEELRKKKEQEREAQKEQRERQRQEEAALKEKQKQEERVARERSKMSDKVRSQYRKEFNQELKRVRGDANSAVLQFFDDEENLHETQEHMLGAGDDDDDDLADLRQSGAKRQLDALFDSIPSCDEVFGLRLAAGVEKSSAKAADWEDRAEILKAEPLDWDDVFQVANSLYAFRNYLKLQTPISLNILVDHLTRLAEAGLPPAPPKVAEGKEKSSTSSSSSSSSLAAAVTGSSDDAAMDVVEESSNAEAKGMSAETSDAAAAAVAESKESTERDDGDDKKDSSIVPDTASAGAASSKKEAIDGEEEWDENEPSHSSSTAAAGASNTAGTMESYGSKAVGRPRKQVVETEVVVNDHTMLNAAQAALDRIHLCLVRALFSELHEVLDLDDKDAADGGRKDKRSAGAKLPLNQLTWPECARMILINQILSDQGREKEDIQNALRGSRMPTFRMAKNVARYIRYRLAVRAKAENTGAPRAGAAASEKVTSHLPIGAGVEREDRLYGKEQESLALLHSDKVPKPRPRIALESEMDGDDDDASPQQQFDSETDILTALQDIAASEEYLEVYQRCAKVLIKVVNLTQAKNFVWEVDSVAFPDYYTTIVRPIMLANVANSVIGRAYGDDYKTVAGAFFNDVRQVFVNCFTYNTEITPLVSQAQKVYQVLWRHARLWLFAPKDELPPIGICDDSHCLLTHNMVTGTSQTTIKCGRCCGNFSVDDLYDIASSRNPVNSTSLAETVSETVIQRIAPFIIVPSNEVRDQPSDEWFCPFCLSEDTSKTASEVPFSLDEWGPSAMVPWIFHPGHSNFASLLRQEDGKSDTNPSLRRMLEAVMILSIPHKSSIVHVDRRTMDKHVVDEIDYSVTESWTFRDRIRVLAGLCEVLKTSQGAIGMLETVNTECDKLNKICTKNSFREADFMKVVREIAGEEGVTACRSLLDGIEDGLESDLHNRITEGRCNVCRGSTYEEDLAEDDEVILCDGCNAEAHIRCLNMSAVPNTAWYCVACSERLALREARAGHSFEDVNRHRDRDAEDELMNRAIDRKAAMAGGKSWSPCERCAYCGLDELDVCSPLVVGMTRAEHDAYIASCKPALADNFFADKRGTKVKFLLDGEEVETPTLEVPYFPAVETVHGQELLHKADAERREAMIVHQTCALQMFQARMDRNRHMLRRRRSVVAQRALNMAGISNRALGTDDSGREYWRFPSSDDLFVRDSAGGLVMDEDEHAFRKLLLKNSASEDHDDDDDYDRDDDDGMDVVDHDASSDDDILVVKDKPAAKKRVSAIHEKHAVAVKKTWKRVSDVNQMRRIVELLSDSPKEAKLRRNLVSGLLCDKKTDSAATQAEATAPAASQAEPAASAESGNAAATAADKEDVPAEEDTAESSVITTATASGRPVKKIVANVVDNNPAELRLIRAKGQDVNRKVVISMENSFIDELEDPDGDEEGQSQSHKSYFNFSKGRYYAIGLLNGNGKTIKGLRNNVTVTYQIHREGISQPLAFTPLNEPWSDNLYYFSPPSFKRSGNYTISFLVEGPNTAAVKPLIFPISVTSQQKCCSAQEAMTRLECTSYVQLGNRQFSMRRSREAESMFHIIQNGYSMWTPHTELRALQRAIVSLYLALPAGSMQMATNESAVGDIFASISEPSGWNDVLDQAWRGAVETATSPATLMECVLLLEHYINKAWLEAPYNKLINALGSPHFAVRSATYSTVAMRVYCLDKALAYNKVVQPSRERRGAVEMSTVSTSNSRSSNAQAAAAAADSGYGRRQRATPKGFYAEDKYEDIEDESPRASSRNERAEHRRGKKREEEEEYSQDEEQDDEEDGDDDEESRRGGWTCDNCTCENSARARTCDACGTRKPSNAGLSRAGRERKRKRYSDYDDNEEEEAEFDDRDAGTRHSSRARKPVSYASVDYDSGEDGGGYSNKKKRGGGSTSSRSPRYSEGDGYDDLDDAQDGDDAIAIVIDFPNDIASLSNRLKSEKEQGNDSDAEITDMALRMMSILRKLKADPDTEIFWEPVNTRIYKSYKQYVSEPMDLGTITMNVKNDLFSADHSLFAKKVRLVWSNCKKFNKGQPLERVAARLEKYFEQLYNDYILSTDRPTNPDIV